LKEQLDPSIFKPDSDVEHDGGQQRSEPPPTTSWVVGQSSLPPASLPPASHESPQLTAMARVNTPRGILAPGSEFGVYRVGACIGEGGMARIYQAEHSGLQRQVALKVLIDGALGAGVESRERFLREARIAAAIKHPNVVNIFDVGVHDGVPYLVMELLSGTDLESLIGSQGALDEGFVVDVMIPIVAGLSAVHDAGVVHRDLKPGNIFLANGRYDEVEPKLLDFGISKASGGAEQLRLTTNGLLVGTPFYMAPEGLGGDEMTPRSDQYSLGVVMYECVTGKNPFSATNFKEIFELIGTATYVAPSVARPGLSKRLERIILRAMSLDPAERFADLRELGRELLLLAGQRTRVTWALSFGDVPRTTLANAAPRALTTTTAPAPARDRARLLMALAASCLLLAAVMLWFGTRAAPPANGAPSATPLRAQVAPAVAEPVSTPSAPKAVEPAVSAEIKPARRTPPRRAQLLRQPAPDAAGPDRELQWELPAANTTSRAATPRTGANGAPIFD
jgi:eukaryotic-like serine/threonine-protein kinase